MSTQGAEFVRSGRKLPVWQKTPKPGTKLQAQYLPQFVRCWRRAGSRVHQVSGKRLTPVLLWIGALFNKAQIIDSFSKDVEMQTWKRAAGHSLRWCMEERYPHRLCQESHVSADRALDFACLCSHQQTSLACGMEIIPTNFSVFVATGEPWPPGSMKCGNVLGTD